MTAHPDHIPIWRQPEFVWAVSLIAGITLIRMFVVILSPFNLGPDEAQYWDWSRDLALGYYSKPPMIAWLIGAETFVCGNSEACIRIGSPIIHGLTSFAIFGLARALLGGKVALWSSVIYLTLPAISFAAGIMSTDLPLLFFWTFGLWALQRFLKVGSWIDAAALGILLGLGFLSKYAMVYFLICLALFLILSPQDRWILKSPKLALSLALAGLLILPNLLWNAGNDFSTLKHTGDNANLGVDLFNLDSLVKFIGDQFGVMGPTLFPILIVAGLGTFWALKQSKTVERPFLLLACFSMPIILIVTFQSFLSRANANWAATTYAAGSILVAAWLLKRNWQPYLKGTVALHMFFGAALYLLTLSSPLIQTLGLGNAFKRVQGWDQIGEQVLETAKAEQVSTVMADDRMILTSLLYYARDLEVPWRIWDYDQIVQSHYELRIPYDASAEGPVLLVARNKEPKRILRRFGKAQFIETVEVTVSENPLRNRAVHLYRLEEFRGRRSKSE